MPTDNGASPCPRGTWAFASGSRSGQIHPTPNNGSDVDKDLPKSLRTGAMLLAIAALAACSTPPAKDFSGSWKPVNRFQNAPTEIPLHPAYVFYASPMDETLKTMLTRWARDSGRELSYRIPFDVTLYQPVAGIRTSDIDDAVAQLNTIYAAQGVLIAANPRRIEVGPVGAGAPNASTSTAVASPVAPAAKK
jgi:hypothetical protein